MKLQQPNDPASCLSAMALSPLFDKPNESTTMELRSSATKPPSSGRRATAAYVAHLLLPGEAVIGGGSGHGNLLAAASLEVQQRRRSPLMATRQKLCFSVRSLRLWTSIASLRERHQKLAGNANPPPMTSSGGVDFSPVFPVDERSSLEEGRASASAAAVM
nr:hypothetical protein Itr_chr12CG14350 [Ipomoea trifida]